MTAPAMAWWEVTGKDGPALLKFYGELFDLTIQEAGDDSGYGLVQAGEIGGGIGAAQVGGTGQVTFAFLADPESHVVGLSKRAIQ